MLTIRKMIFILAALAANNVMAAQVSYTITGDIYVGSTDFNLTGGDIITATGTFDDSALIGGSGTVYFDAYSGNDMTINAGSQTLYAANDTNYWDLIAPSPVLTFDNYSLINFDYVALAGANGALVDFSSYLMYFDDLGTMLGAWRPTVEISAVPVPAAVWLFGSGLIGLFGVARKKK